MVRKYQICTKTIMDTSDPNITFNNLGESDYYLNYINTILPNWNTGESGNEELLKVALKIKKMGKAGILIVLLDLVEV